MKIQTLSLITLDPLQANGHLDALKIAIERTYKVQASHW